MFLRNPIRGIQYSKGEMRWGIVVQTFLTFYMMFLLLAKAPDYSIFNLILSWWLLLANLAAMLIKAAVLYNLSNMPIETSMEGLRRLMRVAFSKRLYKWNVIVTGVCLANYILCLPISIMIWKLEDKVPDLFIYSIIFMLRYFYSLRRYQNYFIKNTDAKNPYGFAEFKVGDSETLTACPKLAEGDNCSICI